MLSFLRKTYYALPPQYRFVVRRLAYYPIDIWESLTGKRPQMTPPRGMIYTGSGDFVKAGHWWQQFFVEQAGLQPRHRVLDVGSGIGRIARGLTFFLKNTEGGTYDGFDAIKLGVDWCTQNISSKYPHFRFQYVPLENDLYRNDGQNAANFTFPYPDDSFDFVILTSVFTHMLPNEVERYLSEIQRIMTRGGVCVATFFMLDDKTRHILTDKTAFNFPYDYEHYALMDDKVKAANVAFDNLFLEKIISENALVIEKKIDGFWRFGKRENEVQDFQDVLILKKI
ncbi:MAG: class I SAM-dependent methyltransferase [Saprospiraceae bacterium]|nr:class I SAM-dependent methyltransferase [Saprospiraceae bacterium]